MATTIRVRYNSQAMADSWVKPPVDSLLCYSRSFNVDDHSTLIRNKSSCVKVVLISEFLPDITQFEWNLLRIN